MYTQISWKSYKIIKTIEKYAKQIFLLKLINCGVQSLWEYSSTKEYTLLILSPDHNLKDNNYPRYDNYLF